MTRRVIAASLNVRVLSCGRVVNLEGLTVLELGKRGRAVVRALRSGVLVDRFIERAILAGEDRAILEAHIPGGLGLGALLGAAAVASVRGDLEASARAADFLARETAASARRSAVSRW